MAAVPGFSSPAPIAPDVAGLRAVNDLTNGDLAAAFSSNPLFIALIPVALTLWFLALRRAWVGAPRTRRQEQVHTRLTWAFGLVVLVFWVARNLPLSPGWLRTRNKTNRGTPRL
ncbi:MAG: DUF2752 domain-containing protein [Marmoricola sp.]